MANESIWQSIDAFKALVKEQIRQGVAVASQYAGYCKVQAQAVIAWTQAQILYYAQNARAWASWCIANLGHGFSYAYEKLAHILKNFPEYAKSAFYKVCGWLYKGYLYGYQFGAFILRSLGDMFKALWNNFVDFIKFIKNNFANMIRALYNATIEFLARLKNDLIVLGKQVYRFLGKIPEYLSNFVHYTKEFLIAAGKEIYRLLAKIPAFFNNIAYYAKQIFTAIGKRLFMGLGMVYGVSAVLVETLGDALNALAMKALGVNLASYAGFAFAQTAISVALAAVVIVAAIRFSYLAIAGVMGMSFINRQTPREILATAREQQPEPQVHPAAQDKQNVVLRQFRSTGPDVETSAQEQARSSHRTGKKTRRAA